MTDTTEQSPRIINREAEATAVVRARERMENLPALYDRAYPALAAALAEQGLSHGAAFGLYGAMNEGAVDIEIGFTTDGVVEPSGDVAPGELPAGEYATITHVGGYDGLGASWEALGRWVKDQGRTAGQTVFEVYTDDPTDADPATLRTDLFWSLD
ncbi:transcriptional regulator [Tessaracoccus terricola]